MVSILRAAKYKSAEEMEVTLQLSPGERETPKIWVGNENLKGHRDEKKQEKKGRKRRKGGGGGGGEVGGSGGAGGEEEECRGLETGAGYMKMNVCSSHLISLVQRKSQGQYN